MKQILTKTNADGTVETVFALPEYNTTKRFTGFTGEISFRGTDCKVENADFTLVIKYPGYLRGEMALRPNELRLNNIVWHGGTVRSGKLTCEDWEGGEFQGDDLVVESRFLGGEFSGKSLNCLVMRGGTVCSGEIKCADWQKGVFLGGVLDCDKWECGSFQGGEFKNGDWLEGNFKDGTFQGVWRGGKWLGGEWKGDSRVGDGDFESIRREKS